MFLPLDMRINETTGGFGFEINSLEELEELSKYFWDLGFTHQLREINNPKLPKIESRYWYMRKNDNFYINNNFYRLFLYPLQYKDYYKLRKALLNLYKIGFLVCYEDNEDAFYLY